MKTNQWLSLMAAVTLALITNGCAHTQTPPPAPSAPMATAPAPAVAPAPDDQAPGAPPAVSPAAAEVVRLSEAGTSDDVILAYIQNDNALFDLSADQILYLRDIGVSSPVITGMLSRDNTLRSQPAGSAPPATMAVSAPPPEPAVTAPLVPETPPVYVSSPPAEVGLFYSDLSPYGTWVQLDGIGWCWQPRVVVINHGWRPYCDSGHWVFTDAGWFWQSDYSWGWAPFHYGRWQLHERCGWVWLPDRVWGPAWVTWRYEGDHCGWAPLPPHAEFDVHLGYRFHGAAVAATFDFGLRPDHFTFIAVRDFHDHDYAHHRLPPTEVTRIYNHTTVINNYVVNNNTVINQGIQPDRVAAATHTEIRKVAIRDVPSASAVAADARGGARTELAVYRPELKGPPRPVNAVAQKVDARHPMIQHTAPAVQSRPAMATTAPNLNRGNGNAGQSSAGKNPARASQDYPSSGAPRRMYNPASSQSGQKSVHGAPNSEQPRPGVANARPAAETASRPSVAASKAATPGQYPLPSTQPGSAQPYHAPAQGQSASPQMNNRPSESRAQPSNNSRPENSKEKGEGNGHRNDP